MTELVTVAGTAFLVMLLAMWATGTASSCVVTQEPHRGLNLERVVDREHLARDVRESARIARRYAARTVRTSDLDSAVERCEATLDGQIMTAHDVALDEIREAASRER
jgi:hypothetical protein